MTDTQQIDPNVTEAHKLIAMAIKFKEQQKGKRPEHFHCYIRGLINNMQQPTFLNLLFELELAATRRAENGEDGEPVESVNRIWETVIFHHRKKGRVLIPFGSVRNCLTRVKKKLRTSSP